MELYDALFADQSLEELILDSDFPPGSPLAVARARMWEGNHAAASAVAAQAGEGFWSSFIVSAARMRAGLGAKRTLLAVAEDPDMESRARLWAYAALRASGEKPSALAASEALGLVAEVPVEHGFDVVAAYVDGRARLLGHADNIVIREPEDGPSAAIFELMGKATVLLDVPAAPRQPPPFAPDRLRFSALSALGVHSVEIGWAETEPPAPYSALFAALLKVFEEVAG
jgi:hypothetical protein